MKKQWKFCFYVAAVLCVSGSCKTNDPSVCGLQGQELTCVATLKKTPADFDGVFFYFEKHGQLLPCPNCEEKLIQGKVGVSTFGPPGTTKPYKYRIWGQIYECTSCPIYAPGRGPRKVYVDKIETVN